MRALIQAASQAASLASLGARILAAGLALGLSGCVNFVTPPGVLVASTPPGAHVLVNGEDTGFVTPCNIDLNESHRFLELSLEGYATTTLFLEDGTRYTIVPWEEGVVVRRSWPFPIFLPFVDLFFPVLVDQSLSPSRIHVDLRLSAEE